MSQHANFLLLGLGNGAVFAALGLALVTTYRSSRVVNFSTSSLALFSAYMYAGLRRGELIILIPGLPGSVELGGRLHLAPAAAIALALTTVLGLVLYLLVFRPLRSAPPVASAVASLGVMIVMTGVITQRRGTSPPPVERIFPAGDFRLGDVHVTQGRAYFALAVAAIAVAVWAISRFTRFGLSTRAAAQSEKGAYLSGISPDRVAALNWMLSALVAGAAGILIAPIVPPVPNSYTLFIIPALAVATLGGFERLGPTVLGGFAVGMLQSEVTYLQVQHWWVPSSGAAELVPLALILVVFVARARPLPARGVLQLRTLGRAPRPRSIARPATIAAGTCLVALVVLEGEWRAAVVTSLIFAVISLSFVVVTGYSGQISLAQLTLAGVAGFILGPITTTWRVPLVDVQLPFPVAPIVAALGATALGVAIGLPAVRIRGLPVAVVTLALALALEAAWFRNTDIVTSSGRDVDGPSLLGLDLSVGVGAAYPRLGFSILVLAVLVTVAVGVAKLRTSRLGTAMLAVRANERSAAAAGVNVVGTKVLAFAIGAFIAGLGGALLAYKQGNVTVQSYTVLLGISIFATAYLAGITSVSGGIVAGLITAEGIVFVAAQHWVDAGQWFQAIAGVGLILAVISHPEGLAGAVHGLTGRRRARRLAADAAEERGAAPPPSLDRPDRTAPPADLAAGEPPALSLRNVRVRYGGMLAVDQVSFEVPRGRIVGLIGPNGAGKTTLLDAINGFAPAEGEVLLEGRPIESLKPHQRVRAGLGRTFQAIELYDDLSVAENIAVGQTAARGRIDVSGEQLEETLAILGISSLRETSAGALSQGSRQLVSIARALVGRPTVLLLDEPAAGLDSTESRWLGDRLRHVRDRGVTILLVDHDMQLVLGLCDEIQVLDFGSLIASGPPSLVRQDPQVAAAYLGTTAVTPDARGRTPSTPDDAAANI